MADDEPGMAPVRIEDLLGSLVAGAQRLTGAAAGSVALVEGTDLVFRVATGPRGDALVGVRIPAGRGIAGYAASSGQPVALDDVRQDPRFARDLAESLGYIPRSIVAVPLEFDGEVVGVLELLDPAPGELSMELLSILARQTASAVSLARAYDELARGLVSPGYATLAADLGALNRLGPREKAAAQALLHAFLDYVRAGDR